ncbi:mannose-1-phosphate guanylyltransferase/mannose-6-phosphate isomerase [Inhella sp.]|uniref:mannose-1-phosphate guanylyltransferase/mannose-6-phosphate isomerase n=1 Tax=Inhella sp. TaxID=1921806 RepID=UPI0035B27B9F
MPDLLLQPVVLCGGSGTRLWPLSRAGFPKQFLVLSGNSSLFQQAAQRLVAVSEPGFAVAPPLVVGNEAHRFLILEQLREAQIEPTAVLLEPSGRNTAPAVTLAALQARLGGADPVLLVTPADQTVTEPERFVQALRKTARAAADGRVVLLGITPDRPETGYGYLRVEAGEAVQAFVEKPDAASAERYLAEGGYFWNAGIFVLRASTWLAALGEFRPDILRATEAAFAARRGDQRFVRPDAALFSAIPAESVDYAVMERCPGSRFAIDMQPLTAGWNDLGAWEAVWQVGEKDADGNVQRGDALLEDCRDTLVHANSRLVAAVGLQDVMVVETADAVLVIDRQRSQQVKAVVERLAREGREEQLLHRKVHRPWGWYDGIDSGTRFKVKRIQVKPGASLSRQMHHHRAEHWIVVRGTAEVTVGGKTLLLSENQSTYIPLGETHRLANPGKMPLEIIEVQSGAYLDEDDIVRFDDPYGRN